jgi:phosphopentomutase
LNELLPLVDESTLLLITSDHGNDPTTPSTDHSREYVPLVAYSSSVAEGCDLGTRATFADVAATIADNFALEDRYGAESFLAQVTGRG